MVLGLALILEPFVWSLYVLLVSVWVLSSCSGFLQPRKDMQLRLNVRLTKPSNLKNDNDKRNVLK